MTDVQRYFRNLAALKSADARAPAANEPRAKTRGSVGHAGRPTENATSSNADVGIRVGTRKVVGPATPSAEGRFLHFANVQPVAHADYTSTPPVPIATTRGDAASFATADAAAQFVLQAGKARSGGSVTAKSRPAPTVQADMNTSEGVAAFILNAGRGKR